MNVAMVITVLDQFDFHHTLTEAGGLSLVTFTSPGCGACKQLKRVFEHHPDEFAGLNLFEVDAQRDMALTNEFNVFHLPSLFLYHDGEFHAEIQAEASPPAIMAAIETALAEPPCEAP